MTKAQLNELSLEDLMQLNRNVVDIIKLKRMVNNKLNADVIQKGMIVIYKGSSNKLQSNEKFEVNKVNKTKATCTSLLTNKTWDLYLANIEPCQKSVINERFINEKEPDANFSNKNQKQISNKDIGLRFCKQVGDGRGFWIDEYNEEQKEFLISIGFKEDRKVLTFKSANTNIFDGWTKEEEQTIDNKIINHFGLTKIQVKQMSFADMI